MSDAIELIRRFCDEFGRGAGVDQIVAYFTDDAVYHNIPVEPAVGPEAIKAVFAMFTTGVERMEFRVRNIAAAGDTVLTERIDIFVLPNVTIELPVMGTFEVRDGKIAAWRDYFDLNQYMTQLAAASS
ncbi:MAG TPA: limonene-1,2-epoxide hydrolase family protein [Acidimicrobiia bacterium]|nr:limonene-1,2-epoxide hydrolase family protein [Acidimicrobiia bacterium]